MSRKCSTYGFAGVLLGRALANRGTLIALSLAPGVCYLLISSQQFLSERVCCQPTQLIRLHQANVEPCGESVGVGSVGAQGSRCQGRHEDNGGKHDEYDWM
jgi:hypothetical protein